MPGRREKWLIKTTASKHKIVLMWENWIKDSKIPEYSQRLAHAEKYTRVDLLYTHAFRYRKYIEHFLVAFQKWCLWVGTEPIETIPSSVSDISLQSPELDTIEDEVYKRIEHVLVTETPGMDEESRESVICNFLAHGGIKFGGKLIGYDFLIGTIYLPPLIGRDAGFSRRYGHVLPALFLNRFIETNTPINIQYSVICHGFDYTDGEEIFNDVYADQMAEHLMKSRAFRDVLKKWYSVEIINQYGKCERNAQFELGWGAFQVRRVCIWLMTNDHVFAVVWEKQENLDIIYPMDNYDDDNPYRALFIKSFMKKIGLIGKGNLSLRKHTNRQKFVQLEYLISIVSDDLVETPCYLACVSFMARCAAFLCSFTSYRDFYVTDIMFNLGTTRDFSVAYRSFEDSLFLLLEHAQTEGRCIWFPIGLNCKFLNINNVHIMSVDYSNKDMEIITNAKHLSYDGTEHDSLELTWVDCKSRPSGGCCMQSLYSPTPIPHCSLLKASALIADCGSIVAGMRL